VIARSGGAGGLGRLHRPSSLRGGPTTTSPGNPRQSRRGAGARVDGVVVDPSSTGPVAPRGHVRVRSSSLVEWAPRRSARRCRARNDASRPRSASDSDRVAPAARSAPTSNPPSRGRTDSAPNARARGDVAGSTPITTHTERRGVLHASRSPARRRPGSTSRAPRRRPEATEREYVVKPAARELESRAARTKFGAEPHGHGPGRRGRRRPPAHVPAAGRTTLTRSSSSGRKASRPPRAGEGAGSGERPSPPPPAEHRRVGHSLEVESPTTTCPVAELGANARTSARRPARLLSAGPSTSNRMTVAACAWDPGHSGMPLSE
jgi:hypothetical protein